MLDHSFDSIRETGTVQCTHASISNGLDRGSKTLTQKRRIKNEVAMKQTQQINSRQG